MQKYNTTENANEVEFPEAGASSNGSATVGTSESTTSTGADPSAGADTEGSPADLGAAAPAAATTIEQPGRRRRLAPTQSRAMLKTTRENKCLSSFASRSRCAPVTRG